MSPPSRNGLHPPAFVAPPLEAVAVELTTPIGTLGVVGRGRVLLRLVLPPLAPGWASGRPEGVRREVAAIADQLDAYLAGDRRAFDLDLAPSGTGFQLRVWSALRTIPYGATASYGEIARRIDQPGAARAVGHANNRNPLAIVVPCHRVIGTGGALVGYGGGLELKARLLALEAAHR